MSDNAKKRILTGDRPTGKLHLGHYIGTLENRVKLQHEYESFIMVADVQALTDNFDNPEKVRDNVLEVAMDNLAVGLDPAITTLFVQSQVPELAELTIYFMNLVSVARLERNPTVKGELKQKGLESNIPAGFFNYPISQAADILGFNADLVPVGDDQDPMIELTREIARRFNNIYGQVFKEPETLTGRVARLIGTDGNAKMSKSIGNVVYLSDSPEEVEAKVRSMFTDPNRKTATDPGTVEGNPVFIYLNTFSQDEAAIKDFEDRYRQGTVGDVEVKAFLAEELNRFLAPIREKRQHYQANPDEVKRILKEGSENARTVVSETMKQVRQAMKLYE